MLSWPARCACVGVLTAATLAGAHGLRGETRGPEAAAGPAAAVAAPVAAPEPPAPMAPLPPALLPHEPQAPVCDSGGQTRPPSAAAPPRSQQLDDLRARIARTLAAYRRRPLCTLENTPWEVMHWAIAYGAGAQVLLGGDQGDPVSALGWLNIGGRCHGQAMVAANGPDVVALWGKGLQGHKSQYLAVLAQGRVALTSALVVDGTAFSVADLVATEQRTCIEGSELTFTLIALAHYLPTDATWTSRDGTEWSLPKLVEEELGQPLRGAACGGSHRLFSLGYACQRRREATGGLDGVYVAADRSVRQQQQRMFSELQNPDGSFSTLWFDRPEYGDDVERQLRTTGHMLEFLVSTADQQVLYHPRTIKAVEFLEGVLGKEPEREWKIGPMCHALHALAIYQERVWGAVTPGAMAAYHGPMKARQSTQRIAARGRVHRAAHDAGPVRR
jgi:hypothetical protein